LDRYLRDAFNSELTAMQTAIILHQKFNSAPFFVHNYCSSVTLTMKPIHG